MRTTRSTHSMPALQEKQLVFIHSFDVKTLNLERRGSTNQFAGRIVHTGGLLLWRACTLEGEEGRATSLTSSCAQLPTWLRAFAPGAPRRPQRVCKSYGTRRDDPPHGCSLQVSISVPSSGGQGDSRHSRVLNSFDSHKVDASIVALRHKSESTRPNSAILPTCLFLSFSLQVHESVVDGMRHPCHACTPLHKSQFQ